MAEKILVVDDESKIRKIVSAYLKQEGYDVKTAADGDEALAMINTYKPDLLVLDLMLPKISGEEICQKIRQDSDLPIIMLTAKGSESERVQGLNIGADDYLVKPFSPRELVARIKAILRRSEKKPGKSEVLVFNQGKLKIYPRKISVKIDDKDAGLTATEFKILFILVSNPGQVMSREQLAEKVMGLEFKGFDRTIDAHIKNIRKKLGLERDQYIITVYGVGYKFIGDNNE